MNRAFKQTFPAPPPVRVDPGHIDSHDGIDMGILPQMMGYMLRQAYLATVGDFFAATAGEDIRPVQFSILEVVKRNRGIRPSDLAAAIGIKRANMVPLLSEIERRGLIQRETVASDRRAQALALTPSGEALLTRLHRLVPAHEDKLAARLGPSGGGQLLHLLHMLVSGKAD